MNIIHYHTANQFKAISVGVQYGDSGLFIRRLRRGKTSGSHWMSDANVSDKKGLGHWFSKYTMKNAVTCIEGNCQECPKISETNLTEIYIYMYYISQNTSKNIGKIPGDSEKKHNKTLLDSPDAFYGSFP